jgi:hypothetical protein
MMLMNFHFKQDIMQTFEVNTVMNEQLEQNNIFKEIKLEYRTSD